MKDSGTSRLIYEAVRLGVDDPIHARIDHPSVDPLVYDYAVDHVYTPITGEIWEPFVLIGDATQAS
jgi:hypothetical protein